MKGLAETLRTRFSDIRNALRARSNEWILKRQGTDDSSVLLHRRRIYILPTRAGLLFATVVLMLLIGSLNYANNMGFALTFLLTGIGLVAMHHCHGNLAGLRISFKQAKPVFAGDKAQFEFILDNNDALDRSQIAAGLEQAVVVCGDIRAENRATFSLPLVTSRRGFIACPRIGLSTTYPLGLFRAWASVHMDLHALVYPRPMDRLQTILRISSEQGLSGFSLSGEDEFSGLREYRSGDSVRNIAWKSAASLGILLVKEYKEGGQTPLWIDWNQLAYPDTESRLSAMCRLVIDADNEQQVYGLRLPGVAVSPEKGHSHLHHCLRELAMFAPTKPSRS